MEQTARFDLAQQFRRVHLWTVFRSLLRNSAGSSVFRHFSEFLGPDTAADGMYFVCALGRGLKREKHAPLYARCPS